MRDIDLWINANLVTLTATLISTTICVFWLPANLRATRTIAEQRGRWLAWVNVALLSVAMLVNVAVFALGLYEIERARAIDRAASAAHPARVPDYVTQGTLVFMGIWLFACVAIIALSSVLSRIIAMPSGATQLRTVGREERAG